MTTTIKGKRVDGFIPGTNKVTVTVQDHQILHGDAAVMLSKIAVDSVQCCITSPSYWKSNQPYDGLGKENTWIEYQQNFMRIFKRVIEVIKPGGYLWLVTGYGSAGFKPGLPWLLASGIEQMGMNLCDEVIWDKGSSSQNGAFDYIFCFQADSQNHSETSFNREIWREIEYVDTFAHWATIPDNLLKRMIDTSSKIGDIILDPFAGSGFTAKIAKEMDRKSISIEIEESLIPIIEKNVSPNS